MVQKHLLLTGSIPKSDEVSLWIPFRGSMESETSFDLTLHPTPIKTPLSSSRTLHAFSLCINYTKAPCTGPPSNAHENQDLNMDTIQEDLLTCFQKKFPRPIPIPKKSMTWRSQRYRSAFMRNQPQHEHHPNTSTNSS